MQTPNSTTMSVVSQSQARIDEYGNIVGNGEMANCLTKSSGFEDRAAHWQPINTANYDVTVALVMYNPNVEKAKRTLTSILRQEGLQIQIVISDDGSQVDVTSELESHLEEHGFTDYITLRSNQNSGTVVNCLRALSASQGIYFKFISPGDYLYSPSSLARAITHMKRHRADLCFAKHVNYSYDTDLLISNDCHPVVINDYLSSNGRIDSKKMLRNTVLYGDYVHGAALVFERRALEDYLRAIAGKVIYCEDFAVHYHLLSGGSTCFFNDYLIWYENNTGISTSGSPEWLFRIWKDRVSFYAFAIRAFPNSNYIRQVYKTELNLQKSTFFSRLNKAIRNPGVLLFFWRRWRNKKKYICNDYDSSLFYYMSGYKER